MTTFENASNTNFTVAQNRRKMIGALEYVRGEFGRKYPLVINGESVTTENAHDSVNPSCKREVVGRVFLATPTDVDRAVAAARRAFKTWRTTRAGDR